jgi:hypothetical protein
VGRCGKYLAYRHWCVDLQPAVGMAHHHIKGSRVSYNQVDTLFCASAFHHLSEGYGWGHKMKKRVMALLVHNETRWVGLSAEAERHGHPKSGQVTH